MYTSEEKEMMMKTARAAGAVGANAVLPRVLKSMIDEDVVVLDFGAGPKAVQTMALRDDGYQVFAHDINPEKTEAHIDDPADYKNYFDVVFASNVINVQPTGKNIVSVVHAVHELVRNNGYALFNYPSSPRKAGLTVSQIEGILKEQFMTVERIRKIDDWKISTPVWKCKKGG